MRHEPQHAYHQPVIIAFGALYAGFKMILVCMLGFVPMRANLSQRPEYIVAKLYKKLSEKRGFFP